MMSAVHVVSVGARTPIGLQAAASAAAVRSGISGMATHPFMIDRLGDLMPAAMDARLDPMLTGPERFVALAESALSEVCTPLVESMGYRLRLPLYLALPELRPGFSAEDAQSVASGFAGLTGTALEFSEVRLSTDGHAAGLLALAAADELIRQGALDACLIGGVESYFHPDTMEWLDDSRQLAGADSRSAFVPGEGVGFCLLLSGRLRERLGLKSLAQVRAASIGREAKLIKTDTVCLGEGLTTTIQGALAALRPPSERINDVICDINGERYRGEEWGFVCLRLPEYFDEPTSYRSPADLWGDMGAASAPLFVMLACEAAAHGYARGTRTLVWASSEHGLRGAAILEFPGSRYV